MFGILAGQETVGHMPEAASTCTPRVSIGLPVFNGERFLRAAIESILAQTFADFELIISDNASTDATPAICEEYARRDGRIRYVRQTENRGGAWNFNHLFSLARGSYFKWAACDDMIAPTYLERCVEALDRRPEAVLVQTRVIKINDRGDHVVRIKLRLATDSCAPWRRFRTLLLAPHGWYQGLGLIRTNALRESPLIGPYSGSDVVLTLWLSLFGSFYEVPEYLFLSRSHAGQSIRMKPRQRVAWFNPGKKDKIPLPEWRLFFEQLNCVRQARLGGYDRLRCYATALRWPLWRGKWLWMVDDLRQALQAALAR
jgi:glycosyltransferase involved in cell wall biosynthesis